MFAKQMKKKAILKSIIFILLVITCTYPITVFGETNDKRVLFISSYNTNFPSVPDQIEGIKSVLMENNVFLDTEFMDTKRFDTSESRLLFYNYLEYKLKNLPPYDAIIVGDDNALQFAMDYQEQLFSNIPIVFLGVNDYNRAKIADDNNFITGIIEEMSLKENIEIALKFNKKATKIVAIVDETLTGQGDKHQFYEMQDKFPHIKFEDINTSNYTFDELNGVLERISDDTILLYMSMYTDKTGKNLTIPEAVEILKEHTKVPIYRAEVGGVGQGVFGGKMVSYYDSGKIAADMVIQVFNGTPIADIKVITESPNKFTFDYGLIKKYDIDMDLIPDGCLLINKKISFFEEYRDIVINTLFVILSLTVIIIILTIDNIKQRRTEKALQESHEELTQIYEELTASEEELRCQYETIQQHAEDIEILNQKYSIAIESTDSAVWEFDIDKNEIYISRNFISAINNNLKEHEAIHDLLNVLLSEESKALIKEEYAKYLVGDKSEINIELPILDQYRNRRYVLVRGKGVQDFKGSFKIIHGIMLDITKLKEQEEYIQYHANHDYLTNLPNRMYFMNHLNKQMEEGKPGAILILDIDNFKGVNDTLGHIHGDKILKEIANRLSEMKDDKVFISRFGGDEFLVLISNENSTSNIENYIEKMMQLFGKPIFINNKEHIVKFSIGISRFPYDSSDMDQLLMNADTAMYNVKRNGKNNYMFYSSDMLEEVKEKSEIEAILRTAIKEEGFVLVYQPQVCVTTGNIIGFEALLRLKNYNISPAKFIAVAEETGLIKEIGRWVTKSAISQIADWRKQGIGEKPVAINFSSKQIKDKTFLSFLKETMELYQVKPEYVEIEITESVLLEKNNSTLDYLNQLKEMGLRIALDDFGTGYSSLNYLTYIPVNKIKLDKSLCEKFLEHDNDKVMNSLIALVHSLNLVITAEGVEEMEQFLRLKIGGCDYIQGYLFSRPLEAKEIEKIYNQNMLDVIVK